MLRIDLLPSHFAAARAAKMWLVIMVILLLLTTLGCFGFLMLKKQELARVTRERDEAKRKADEVRRLEQQAQEKENLAAPIDAKVTFIEDADGCGEQWWDAFEKVNRYIYARARVTAFRIQAPNAVHFEVELPDTTSCGRFVLNLIRCPDITNIRIGGAPPPGPGVGPNVRASAGGMGGMPGMPGGGEPMMGGMAGMPGPGGMGMGGGPMPGMGAPGGMPGMAGGGPSAPSSAAGGVIRLSVDASLVKQLSTPVPGGGAAAAAAGGGMPGMAGGMPMMGGGMPGMGGSMPGPGGAGPGAGPPAGGAAKAPGPPAGGEKSRGGLGRKGGADMDME